VNKGSQAGMGRADTAYATDSDDSTVREWEWGWVRCCWETRVIHYLCYVWDGVEIVEEEMEKDNERQTRRGSLRG
jgi:hypothetical protein